MPSLPATERASPMSLTEQRPFERSSLHSSDDQVLIVAPTTSQPSRFRIEAATELSTPPDMANKTLLLIDILVVVGSAAFFAHLAHGVTQAAPDFGKAVRPAQDHDQHDDYGELRESEAEHG